MPHPEPKTLEELERISARVRAHLVRMSYRARTPHLGSSLSCVDILVAAYFSAVNLDPDDAGSPDRDRFILSKGHAAPALYHVLCERGLFGSHLLDEYNQDGAVLAEQPVPFCVPGLEAATGSLGHGLPIALGLALACRIQKRSYRVFVAMSDGECNEGSVWEAAMYAPARRLDNLLAIIDFNKWQATGRSEEIMSIQPLRAKWDAFGWNTHEIDGHDLGALVEVLGRVPDGSGKPIAVVANTIKGKGVSFMEDDNNWHYRVPTEAEVRSAWDELGVPWDEGTASA